MPAEWLPRACSKALILLITAIPTWFKQYEDLLKGGASAQELLPDFRRVAEAYFGAMRALGMRLVRLVALALDLPPDYFTPMFSQPMLYLRPLHYALRKSDPGLVCFWPACLPDQHLEVQHVSLRSAAMHAQGVFGAGAHSDYGEFTLLPLSIPSAQDMLTPVC